MREIQNAKEVGKTQRGWEIIGDRETQGGRKPREVQKPWKVKKLREKMGLLIVSKLKRRGNQREVKKPKEIEKPKEVEKLNEVEELRKI